MTKVSASKEQVLKNSLYYYCFLYFADIQFKVDNGTILAHKPILMARCEMMYAMFNDNFMEASADLVIKYHYILYMYPNMITSWPSYMVN